MDPAPEGLTVDERLRYRRWVGLAAVASAVLRLRFLATPLGIDEAGTLAVARAWGHGQHLYVDTFIDRPQGMPLLFRGWDRLIPGHPSTIRVLAVLAGIAVVLGAGAAARAVTGRWQAGAAAAWLVAVISSSAAFEGHTANGELLAGAFTVPAAAVGALVLARRRPAWWLAIAGALAAVGIGMKQSGFDVLVALVLWLAVAWVRRWAPSRELAVRAGWLIAGAAVVLGGLAIHGASFGWGRYAYAILGFRLHARSAIAGPQGRRMAITMAVAAPLLVPTAVVAWRHVRRRTGAFGARALFGRLRPVHWFVVLWLLVASAGFVIGGNYHRHYWIQLTFPFAVLAGVALATGSPAPDALRSALAWSLALPLAISIVLIAAPGIEQDDRVATDALLATWVEANAPPEHRRLITLCASTAFYVEAEQDPPYPYLWVDHVRSGRNATPALVELLDGEQRPDFVALHQDLERCDPTGEVGAALDRNYEPVATVDGVAVLRATR